MGCGVLRPGYEIFCCVFREGWAVVTDSPVSVFGCGDHVYFFRLNRKTFLHFMLNNIVNMVSVAGAFPTPAVYGTCLHYVGDAAHVGHGAGGVVYTIVPYIHRGARVGSTSRSGRVPPVGRNMSFMNRARRGMGIRIIYEMLGGATTTVVVHVYAVFVWSAGASVQL